MSAHTEGELACYNDEVFLADDENHIVAHVLTSIYETDRLVATDARRIAACWNACAGSETDGLEEMQQRGLTLAQLAALYARTKQQRDDLLKACKQALYALKGREHDQFLRDAIANAEKRP